MQTLKTIAIAAALLTGAVNAQADLIDRGNGLIYDTTLNLTWLADMNYAVTTGYAAANAGGSDASVIYASGRMGWDAATTWATNLTYAGISGWRLPTLNSDDTSCNYYNVVPGYPLQYTGLGCMGGELSHLYTVDLGNKPGVSVLDTTGNTPQQIANLALFRNLKIDGYWSSSEFVPNPTGAWLFTGSAGFQGYLTKTYPLYATVVHVGDVAAVPEPQSIVLMLCGGLAVALRARSRRAVTTRA